MWQNQANKSSYRESLKGLEADIQHANNLAGSLPRDFNGDCVQMRLSYSPLAPLFLYLMEWMDFSCTDSLPTSLGLLHILIYKVYVDGIPSMSSKERKASLREFYTVIYPSLTLLQGELAELEDRGEKREKCLEAPRRIREDRRSGLSPENDDREREIDQECGICMENSTKMVLPNCGHTMCIHCFHDWNRRSESCPFCRGSLKRVSSTDLWVLTSENDVIDPEALAKENLRRFYRYIDYLPSFVTPDTHVLLIDYML